MKIAMAIATAGRRDVLNETIAWLKTQTRPADRFYLAPASDKDLDEAALEGFPSPCEVIKGAKGLPAQRNAILRQLKDEDIVVFFDDDFLPEPNFLQELEALFASRPGLAIATGHVVADGAHNAGISTQDGIATLQALTNVEGERIIDTFGGYGCNMAINAPLARSHNILFDEVLPLYAWWEDIDFSRRLAPYGDIKQSFRLRGVHLGSKSGRSPGKRLGYSQVANILYMARKGSISHKVAFRQIMRNVAANMMKSFKPEPWVDRKGRLSGNILAFGDALRGRVDPQRILKM